MLTWVLQNLLKRYENSFIAIYLTFSSHEITRIVIMGWLAGALFRDSFLSFISFRCGIWLRYENWDFKDLQSNYLITSDNFFTYLFWGVWIFEITQITMHFFVENLSNKSNLASAKRNSARLFLQLTFNQLIATLRLFENEEMISVVNYCAILLPEKAEV